MRALSAQETAVQALDVRRVAVRVWIKNASGTYVDFSTLGGRNWIISAEWGVDVDSPCWTAKIVLRRDFYDFSLSPLMSASTFNSPAAAIDVWRGVKIETAVVPADLNYQVQEADWVNVFEGYVEDLDQGGDKSEVILQCRDLGAKLAVTWLEKDGRNTSPVTQYGASVSSGGENMEDVLQDVLDDWASGITVYTPAGTDTTPIDAGDVSGWFITQPDSGANGSEAGWGLQKQSVLDALHIFANQIGYDIRYRWHDWVSGDSGTDGKWRLEVYNPPRGNTTPDGSIRPGQVLRFNRIGRNSDDVRNAIGVGYPADPTSAALTYMAVLTDAASIAKYGRRYAEVSVGATFAIHDSTQAANLQAAILSDLKDPKEDWEAECVFMWQWELGDLITFGADGVHFDANADLAVTSIRHAISAENGKARTTLGVRSTGPIGQASRWWAVWGGRGIGIWGHNFVGNAPQSPTAAAIIGGGSFVIPQVVSDDIVGYETHVSATSGFTPDSSTLQNFGKQTQVTVANLTPGTTYYVKTIAVRRDGQKSDASAEASFTAGTADTAHIGDLAITTGKIANNAVTDAKVDAARALVAAGAVDTGSGNAIDLGAATGWVNRTLDNIDDDPAGTWRRVAGVDASNLATRDSVKAAAIGPAQIDFSTAQAVALNANADFIIQSDASTISDGWEIVKGLFGSQIDVVAVSATGDKSLKFFNISAPFVGDYAARSASVFPVQGGENYMLDATIQQASGAIGFPVDFVVEWYQSDGVTASAVTAETTFTPKAGSAGTWRRVFGSVTAPSDARWARLRVQQNLYSTSVIYVDRAALRTPTGPSKFSGYMSGSVAVGAGLRVPIDTAEWDNTAGSIDLSSNKGRFQPSAGGLGAGKYRFSGTVGVTVTAAGAGVIATIRKNGSTVKNLVQVYAHAIVTLYLPFDVVVDSAVGDYWEIWVFTSNSAGTLVGSSAGSFLQIEQVG